MNKKYIVGLVVVVLAAVGYLVFAGKRSTDLPPQNSQASEQASLQQDSGMAAGQKVVFTDGGFSPSTITIKKGESVTWVNQSSGGMWVASNIHPSHAEYSGTALREHCPDTAGTAFDECGTGSSYTFTFEKAGTWQYHNHVDAQKTGTIIVTE